MFDDFDPRDVDSPDRDDGIYHWEDDWLVLGRGPGSREVHDDTLEHEIEDLIQDLRTRD